MIVIDQPFYYGGMLNVFRMRSTLARMALDGADLTASTARFTKLADLLRARGGGTISIYYHPSEWFHASSGTRSTSARRKLLRDRRGDVPGRARRRKPRPLRGLRRCNIRFIQKQSGVGFVTASDLMRLYADRAMVRAMYSREDVRAIAATAQPEITFQRRQGETLSAADVFSLLTGAMAGFVRSNVLPEASRVTPLDGPTRAFAQPAGGSRAPVFPWEAFSRAVTDAADFCRTNHRVPDAESGRHRQPVARGLPCHARARRRARHRHRRAAEGGLTPRRPLYRGSVCRRGFDEVVELADLPGGLPRPGHHGAGAAPGVDVEPGGAHGARYC